MYHHNDDSKPLPNIIIKFYCYAFKKLNLAPHSTWDELRRTDYSLSTFEKQLRIASEQRKELERQHAEALSQLRERKDEVGYLTEDKKKSVETIDLLESKIRELEKKTELQNVRHEELMLELTAIKRSHQSQSIRASSSRHSSLGHSPPDSPICSTPDSLLSRGESTAISTPVVPSLDAILEISNPPSSQSHHHQHHHTTSSSSYHYQQQQPGQVVYSRGLYEQLSSSGGGGGGGDLHAINTLVNGDVSEYYSHSQQQHQNNYTISNHTNINNNNTANNSSNSQQFGSKVSVSPWLVSHTLPRPQKSSYSPIRNQQHPHGRKRLRRSNSVTDLSQTPHSPPPTAQHQQQNNKNNNMLTSSNNNTQNNPHHQHQHNSNDHVTNLSGGVRGRSSRNNYLFPQKSFDEELLASSSSHEIERLVAKIEQDNKILAELDKTAVFGSASCPPRFSTQKHHQQQHQQQSEFQRNSKPRTLSPQEIGHHSRTQRRHQHQILQLLPLPSPSPVPVIVRQGRRTLPKKPMTTATVVTTTKPKSSKHQHQHQHEHQLHHHIPKITFNFDGEISGCGGTSSREQSSGVFEHHTISSLNPSHHLYQQHHHHHNQQHQQTQQQQQQQQQQLQEKHSVQSIGQLPQFQQIATVLPNFIPVLQAGTQLFPSGNNLQSHMQAQQQLQQQQVASQQLSQIQQQGSMPISSVHVDHHKRGTAQPQILNGSNILMDKHASQHFHIQHQKISPNKSVDVLDIPGKGRCFVFIARYSYDPFSQSPNDNPEAELSLNGGDYILVWGSMDEDGFLDGELLDGRRGLVPSNYVERLLGEDLLEFHQQVVLGVKDTEDCFSTSLHDFDYGSFDVMDESQRLVMEELMNRRREEYSYLDLEDIVDDDLDPEKQVLPPVQLTLERQLNKSILIAWNPPECPPGSIESYQVYVNGLLRCSVKANDRTRALVEGVDCNRPHRISVRSVTPHKRTSRDAGCTMVIGKDAPLAPSCIRATNVTSTSAVISWLPSSSNYQHVVCVNNVEVRTVKPGVYRHLITGLTPHTTYRVTVRSKNIRAPNFDEKNSRQIERLSSHTEFRTLAKGYLGMPDPPVDVQIEVGPQNNTILVTWNPVTTGSSNGAVVTGYAVFADGRKVLDIDSPSGDHALLDLNRFQGGIPKQVTVRTKSRDSLSSDSVPIVIPPNVLIKGRRHRSMGQINSHSLPRRGRFGGMMYEGDESFSDTAYGPNIPSIESDRQFRLAQNQLDYQQGKGLPPRAYSQQDRPITARGYHPQTGAPMPPYYSRGKGPMPPEQDPYRDPYGPLPWGPQPLQQQQQQQTGPSRGRGPPRLGQKGEVRHRLFVALFDYDPPTMSPNPDACDEELPFREGQTIKIFGEKDADGFYWGECGGRRGYVPCNMVSEIQSEEERNSQDLFMESMGEGLPVSGRERRAMGRDRWGDIYTNMPVKKMIALYDYDPQELSPNVDSEVELSFQTGEIIFVYGDMDDDGFYMGEINGVRGLVPSNFLTDAPSAIGDYPGDPQQRGPPQPGPPGGRRPFPGGPGMGPGPGMGMGMGSGMGGPAPHFGPPDPRRAMGPGARGPPPPPREGGLGRGQVPQDRQQMMMEGGPGGRRKDASYPLDNSELRNHYEGGPPSRRGGRGGGPGPQQGQGRGRGTTPTTGTTPGRPGQQQQQQQQQQNLQDSFDEYPSDSQLPPPVSSTAANKKTANLRGAPAVLPEFSPTVDPQAASVTGAKSLLTATTTAAATANATTPVTSSANPLTGKLPGVFSETPNFMQKFTEFTQSATGGEGGEGLLSKGKDMIFKRFGL